MRRLLGAMRQDGQALELTPQPGLDRLDSLLEEVSRAGLPVRLHVDGDRFPLPRGVDLSAYRIIQEGLTNALKHADASHADVTVRYGSNELQIEILDDGRGAATTNGVGHGLVGIRERVKIYGGEMTAGSENGGGFLLSTRLPLGGDRGYIGLLATKAGGSAAVISDGNLRQIYAEDSAELIESICASPNGQYLAVTKAPREAATNSDSSESENTTELVDTGTGRTDQDVPGSNINWCS